MNQRRFGSEGLLFNEHEPRVPREKLIQSESKTEVNSRYYLSRLEEHQLPLVIGQAPLRTGGFSPTNMIFGRPLSIENAHNTASMVEALDLRPEDRVQASLDPPLPPNIN